MLRGFSIFSLFVTLAAAQDHAPLPVGEMDFFRVAPEPLAVPGYLKPTKSVKPPTAALTTGQPQVHAPVAARLRRLILLPGGMSQDMVREHLAIEAQRAKPMTVVGMTAPAPVLADLASFFGDAVNEETRKKLIHTVGKGMGKAAKPRRVEVVGWAPQEGVMTLAVYPEG